MVEYNYYYYYIITKEYGLKIFMHEYNKEFRFLTVKNIKML